VAALDKLLKAWDQGCVPIKLGTGTGPTMLEMVKVCATGSLAESTGSPLVCLLTSIVQSRKHEHCLFMPKRPAIEASNAEIRVQVLHLKHREPAAFLCLTWLM